MKRLLTILTITGMFLALSTPDGWAVEKKPKDSTTVKKAPPPNSSNSKKDDKKKVAPKTAEPTTSSKAKAKDKKYDSFVDKNKNGVDDRQEKPTRKDEARK